MLISSMTGINKTNILTGPDIQNSYRTLHTLELLETLTVIHSPFVDCM